MVRLALAVDLLLLLCGIVETERSLQMPHDFLELRVEDFTVAHLRQKRDATESTWIYLIEIEVNISDKTVTDQLWSELDSLNYPLQVDNTTEITAVNVSTVCYPNTTGYQCRCEDQFAFAYNTCVSYMSCDDMFYDTCSCINAIPPSGQFCQPIQLQYSSIQYVIDIESNVTDMLVETELLQLLQAVSFPVLLNNIEISSVNLTTVCYPNTTGYQCRCEDQFAFAYNTCVSYMSCDDMFYDTCNCINAIPPSGQFCQPIQYTITTLPPTTPQTNYNITTDYIIDIEVNITDITVVNRLRSLLQGRPFPLFLSNDITITDANLTTVCYPNTTGYQCRCEDQFAFAYNTCVSYMSCDDMFYDTCNCINAIPPSGQFCQPIQYTITTLPPTTPQTNYNITTDYIIDIEVNITDITVVNRLRSLLQGRPFPLLLSKDITITDANLTTVCYPNTTGYQCSCEDQFAFAYNTCVSYMSCDDMFYGTCSCINAIPPSGQFCQPIQYTITTLPPTTPQTNYDITTDYIIDIEVNITDITVVNRLRSLLQGRPFPLLLSNDITITDANLTTVCYPNTTGYQCRCEDQFAFAYNTCVSYMSCDDMFYDTCSCINAIPPSGQFCQPIQYTITTLPPTTPQTNYDITTDYIIDIEVNITDITVVNRLRSFLQGRPFPLLLSNDITITDANLTTVCYPNTTGYQCRCEDQFAFAYNTCVSYMSCDDMFYDTCSCINAIPPSGQFCQPIQYTITTLPPTTPQTNYDITTDYIIDIEVNITDITVVNRLRSFLQGRPFPLLLSNDITITNANLTTVCYPNTTGYQCRCEDQFAFAYNTCVSYMSCDDMFYDTCSCINAIPPSGQFCQPIQYTITTLPPTTPQTNYDITTDYIIDIEVNITDITVVNRLRSFLQGRPFPLLLSNDITITDANLTTVCYPNTTGYQCRCEDRFAFAYNTCVSYMSCDDMFYDTCSCINAIPPSGQFCQPIQYTITTLPPTTPQTNYDITTDYIIDIEVNITDITVVNRLRSFLQGRPFPLLLSNDITITDANLTTVCYPNTTGYQCRCEDQFAFAYNTCVSYMSCDDMFYDTCSCINAIPPSGQFCQPIQYTITTLPPTTPQTNYDITTDYIIDIEVNITDITVVNRLRTFLQGRPFPLLLSNDITITDANLTTVCYPNTTGYQCRCEDQFAFAYNTCVSYMSCDDMFYGTCSCINAIPPSGQFCKPIQYTITTLPPTTPQTNYDITTDYIIDIEVNITDITVVNRLRSFLQGRPFPLLLSNDITITDANLTTVCYPNTTGYQCRCEDQFAFAYNTCVSYMSCDDMFYDTCSCINAIPPSGQFCKPIQYTITTLPPTSPQTNYNITTDYIIDIEVNITDITVVNRLRSLLQGRPFPLLLSNDITITDANLTTVCYPNTTGYQCRCEDQFAFAYNTCVSYMSCDDIFYDTCSCINAIPPSGQFCQPIQYTITTLPPTTPQTNYNITTDYIIDIEVNITDITVVNRLRSLLQGRPFPLLLSNDIKITDANLTTVCYPNTTGYQCRCEDQFAFVYNTCVSYMSCDDMFYDTCSCINAIPPSGQFCQPLQSLPTTTIPENITSPTTPVLNSTLHTTPPVNITSLTTPVLNSTLYTTPPVNITSPTTPVVNSTLHTTPLENITSTTTPVLNLTLHTTPPEDITSATTPILNSTFHTTPPENITSLTTPILNSTLHTTPPVNITSPTTPVLNSTLHTTPPVNITSLTTPVLNSTLHTTPPVNITSPTTPVLNSTLHTTPPVNITSPTTPVLNSTLHTTPPVNITSPTTPVLNSTLYTTPPENITSPTTPVLNSTLHTTPPVNITSPTTPVLNSTLHTTPPVNITSPTTPVLNSTLHTTPPVNITSPTTPVLNSTLHTTPPVNITSPTTPVLNSTLYTTPPENITSPTTPVLNSTLHTTPPENITSPTTPILNSTFHTTPPENITSPTTPVLNSTLHTTPPENITSPTTPVLNSTLHTTPPVNITSPTTPVLNSTLHTTPPVNITSPTTPVLNSTLYTTPPENITSPTTPVLNSTLYTTPPENITSPTTPVLNSTLHTTPPENITSPTTPVLNSTLYTTPPENITSPTTPILNSTLYTTPPENITSPTTPILNSTSYTSSPSSTLETTTPVNTTLLKTTMDTTPSQYTTNPTEPMSTESTTFSTTRETIQATTTTNTTPATSTSTTSTTATTVSTTTTATLPTTPTTTTTTPSTTSTTTTAKKPSTPSATTQPTAHPTTKAVIATTAPITSTQLQMSFKILQPFTNDLNNPNSTLYQKLKSDFQTTMNNFYKQMAGFLGVTVTGFSPGSVITNYEMNVTTVNTNTLSKANLQIAQSLTAQNYSVDTTSFQAYIFEYKRFQRNPDPVYAGDNLSLVCLPPSTLMNLPGQWIFGGITLSNTSKYTIINSPPTLIVNNVSSTTDTGMYQCVVQNSILTYTEEESISVNQIPNPTIGLSFTQLFVQCGTGPVTFQCCVTSNLTNTVVQWTNGSVILTSNSDMTLYKCVSYNYTSSACTTVTLTCNAITRSIVISESATLTLFTGASTCTGAPYGSGRDSDVSVVGCDPNYVGSRSAVCTNGVWSTIKDTCVLSVIAQLENSVPVLNSANLGTFVQTLQVTSTNFTSQIVSSQNTIITIVNILGGVANVSHSVTISQPMMENILDTVSVLVSPNSLQSWQNMNSGNASAEQQAASSNLLNSMETLAGSLSNDSFSITKDSIILNKTTFDVSFNTALNASEIWLNSSTLGTSQVTTIVFTTLNSILPARNASNITTNNVISGIVMLVKTKAIVNNVTLSFNVNNASLANPQCVYWNFTLLNGTGGWDSTGCVAVSNSNGSVTCFCNHLTSFSILMSPYVPQDIEVVLDYITYIGVSISLASLVVCLLIEAFVWTVVTKNRISYMRHVSIVNIAVSLLIADIWFIVGAAISGAGKTNLSACSAAAFFIHFFYLALFFWMLTSALLLLYHTVLLFSDLSKRKMMAISFSLGYGAPLLIAIITIAVTAPKNGYIRQDNYCWLNWDPSKALLAFVIPALTIILVNLVVLIVVVVKMLRRGIGENRQLEERNALVVIARCIAILTPFFGLTWSLGVGTMVSTNRGVHISFAVFNSLQGFFILVFGTLLDSRIRAAIVGRFSFVRWISNRTTSTSAPSSSSSNARRRMQRRRFMYNVSDAASSSQSVGTESHHSLT